jgi:hypothetical protein
MQPSHIHTGHLSFEPYASGLTLRTGETVEFSWNPSDDAYFNIFGNKPFRNTLHGPYAVACGSGRLTSKPLSEQDAAEEYGLHSMENMTWMKTPTGGLRLHPTASGKTASWVLKVALPYIITDIRMDATVLKKAQKDAVAVYISTDAGSSWRKYWEAQQSPEPQTVSGIALSDRYNPTGKQPLPPHSAFGRYTYLIKVEMSAANDPQGCRLEELAILTKFQHNIFALPMLWPGRNEVSVEGKLREDRALSVVFEWEDARGNPRISEMNVREIPFRRSIEVKGDKWEDIICRTLRIGISGRPPGESAGISIPPKPAPKALTLHTAVSTDTIIGTNQRPKPPSGATLIRRVEEALRRQSEPAISDSELRKIAGPLGDTLLALGALRDSAAHGVLARVINESRTHAFQHRILAMQALYNTVGQDSAPDLMRVLRKDPGVIFYDPKKEYSKDAMWLNAAATAAAALAAIGDFAGKNEAADMIEATLQNRMTSVPLRRIWRGEEIEWGLIRALGILGSRRHAAALYSYLTPGNDSDAMAEAIRALGRMDAREALPRIAEALQKFQYLPVGLHAVEAVGRLGGQKETDLIFPFLYHGDEEMRAATASALGMIGGPDISARLRNAENEEKMRWVREAIKAASERAASQR